MQGLLLLCSLSYLLQSYRQKTMKQNLIDWIIAALFGIAFAVTVFFNL